MEKISLADIPISMFGNFIDSIKDSKRLKYLDINIPKGPEQDIESLFRIPTLKELYF